MKSFGIGCDFSGAVDIAVKAAATLAVCSAASVAYADATDVRGALDASKVDVNFRYRIENVDQDGLSEDALASTLRSRVSLQTGAVYGVSSLLEVDNVSVIGGELYNNTLNGKTSYPTVADPAGTDINQVLLRYKSQDNNAQIDLGRQRINELNQRFLGSVGWRQNEQTLDGYRVQYKFPKNVSVDISHFYNVNRVFGPEGTKADEHGDFNNLVVQWAPQSTQQVSVFYHNYEFDNWAVRSSVTAGVDYLGSFINTKSQKLQVHLAYANQAEGDNSPADFSNAYSRLDVNWKINAFNAELGIETLGGDGKTAVQTPLATLHQFNGFADMFLNTPANGLQDKWLGAGYLLHGKCQLSAQYHDYHSDRASIHYGSELNLTATHTLSKQLQLLAKIARYSADDFAKDTNKLWLGVNYSL